MPNVTVLGAGLVGRIIALDLILDKGMKVRVVDNNIHTLRNMERDVSSVFDMGSPVNFALDTCHGDLSDPNFVRDVIKDADVVVGAMPGFLGYRTLRTIIESGKSLADISFMPENAMELDNLAKDKGVTAVVDCGVAPGLSNLFCGRAVHMLDCAERMLILVGGLPKKRVWPFEYRIVFSPADVIEEYTRPARWIEGGQWVVKPALTDIELVDLPNVGTLEAFNTDGLRSIGENLKVPFMKEKTLRFSGHAEKMRMLRETGFLSVDPIHIGGQRVKPFDVTTKLLFDAWKMPEGEADFTVMRVTVDGIKSGVKKSYIWDLYDEYDPLTNFSSMARTTGFPCAIIARMLAKGELVCPGVVPPELLGSNDVFFKRMIDGLSMRGIDIRLSEK